MPRCSCSPAQDINVGGRPTRTLFQYTLQDPDLDELNQWAPKIYDKLKTLPELTDVATDQQTGGATLTLTIDRDQAARFGIQPQLIDDTLYDAFGERQVTQYFTQVNSYHVIMEVLPELQDNPQALEHIFIKSPLTGQQVPLSTLVKWTTKPTTFLSINHQGQFPAVTLSFNLAPGVALGEAVTAIQQAEAQTRRAGVADRHLPGQRPGVPVLRSNRSPFSSPPRSSSSISSSACSTRATSIR